MAASLRFLSGALKGHAFRVATDRPVRIGRDAECEICLRESDLSPVHARLDLQSGRLLLATLGAVNGVYVNGRATGRADLALWDVVVVGGCAFRIEGIEDDDSGVRRAVIAQRTAALPDLGTPAVYQGVLMSMLALERVLAEEDEQLVPRALAALFAALPASRLTLVTIDSDGRPAESFSCSRQGTPTSHLGVAHARRVLEGGHRALLIEEDADSAVVGAVVHAGITPVAVVLADNHEEPGALDARQLPVLEVLVRALEPVCARDVRRRLEARQLLGEHDFLASRRLQAQILTKTPSNLRSPMRWALHHQPAIELGGDFYDVHESSLGVTWVVADVCGKGLPCALALAMLKAFCKTLHPLGLGPRTFLLALDDLFKGEMPSTMFFTAMVAQVGPRGEVTWCNLGQPPAYVLRGHDRSLVALDPVPGMLGMAMHDMFANKLADRHITLARGDRICLYTDGLVEAARGDVTFGVERLTRLLVSGASKSLDRCVGDLVSAACDHHGSFHLEDDCTVVIGEW